jgi:iron-sulfur cluster assembly protein
MKRGTPHAAIRVGLRGGGCTGYTYVFDWEEGEPRARDTVIETHGVRVYVDPKSLKLLGGMELDFTRKLMGHGFQFNNPNAKGSCGCGAAVQF